MDLNLSPDLPFVSSYNLDFLLTGELWWFVLWLYIFLGVLFGLVVLYHWLRYETNSVISSVVIVTNAIVILTLLGGASINLNVLLS